MSMGILWLILIYCFCFQQIAFMANCQHHHINSRDSLACNLSLSKSHNAYNTKLSLTNTSHFNSNSLFLFLIFSKFTNSFHSLICSCLSRTSFQSISPQNYWQILLPPSSCSLEFTAQTKTRRYVWYVFYNLLQKRINTRILWMVKNEIRYILYTINYSIYETKLKTLKQTLEPNIKLIYITIY